MDALTVLKDAIVELKKEQDGIKAELAKHLLILQTIASKIQK